MAEPEISYSVELKKFENGKEVDSIGIHDYGFLRELLDELEEEVFRREWLDDEFEEEEDEGEDETKGET